MLNGFSSLLAGLSVVLGGWDGVIDPADYLDQKTLKRLDAGKVVQFPAPSEKGEGGEKGREGGGIAFVRVKRPADSVFDHLIDFEHHPEFMHRVVDVELLKSEEDRAVVKQTIKVPVYGEVSYHLIFGIDKARRVLTYRLDDERENDIAATQGRWIVIPRGEGECIVAYTAYADTGRKIPKVLESWLLSRDLPAVVKSLRKYSEAAKEDEEK